MLSSCLFAFSTRATLTRAKLLQQIIKLGAGNEQNNWKFCNPGFYWNSGFDLENNKEALNHLREVLNVSIMNSLSAGMA